MRRRNPRKPLTRLPSPPRAQLRLTGSVLALLSTVLLALAAIAHAEGYEPNPVKETGSPITDQGSSYHYRSYITGVSPSIAGLNIQVLQFADRLELINHTGKTITVYGYEGEPYAQVLADGTVRVNTHSPAYYLNQAFYANVTVPPYATAHAQPQWTVVDRTGRLEWHDHRIHWMSPVVPPEVKDQSKRTKIFNWKVPISVGSTAGDVSGELFWVPEGESGTPVGAIAALVVLILAGIWFVWFVRRRRSTSGTGTGPGEGERPTHEAW
jgi:hypothetical protein